ncbi:MAG: fibronectin type III domain-containing protein [Lutibacter sp.]|uniref:fibronectin type III domain-containing protein n=1 Tax=Lutibacter sp. TaxID=1925666 RepID=UPI00385C8A80
MNNLKQFLFLFLVVIFNSCGGSDDSPEPVIDIIPPTAPTNLQGDNITKTSLDLTWTASTDNVGVTAYILYRNGINYVATTSTTYTITGLNFNTNYNFKISAKDAAENESSFSNVLEITTEDDNPILVKTTGNIETYIGNFINGVPGDSGNNYKKPTSNQLVTWEIVINEILNQNISEAVLKSSELNYQINEFTDTTLTPNQIFYILEEKSVKENHWGVYVFSKTPSIGNLILQAPHIKNDINTGKQAFYCFKNNLAKAVFLSGTHRCNHSEFSSCSGTTTTCNSGSQPYRISDMAHNTNTVFQKTTEILYTNVANSVFIQLHGFGKNDSDPYVIMSNGTRETPTIDYALQIKEALMNEDSSLTFKLAHLDTDWTRLIGFTNTQGRFINGSSNPCNTSATTTTGRFIHIEQEKSKLRENQDGWLKMSNALKSVFE